MQGMSQVLPASDPALAKQLRCDARSGAVPGHRDQDQGNPCRTARKPKTKIDQGYHTFYGGIRRIPEVHIVYMLHVCLC